jgi:putative membrane protein
MRKLTLLKLVFCIGLAAAPASAHVAGSQDPASWNSEVWLPVLLATTCWWYALGRWRMPARVAASPRVGRTQIAAFAAGMLSLVIALESPIDTIAEDLFSVHMVQHLLLMLVAAPLFVWSRPLVAFLWAMERGTRKALGRLWAGRGVGRVFAFLTSPISVWISFCGLFAFWHLPGPYAWALTHEFVHVLEHLCFFMSAFAFWSIVIEPSGRRRLDCGATLLFVATAAVLSSLPGALMILTSRPFYAVHAAGAARWGLTPIEDQQLAGLIMWIPAGFVYIAAILVLFGLWMRAAERRSTARLRRIAATGLVPMVLLIVLSGCGEGNGGKSADNPSGAGFGDPQKGAEQIAQTGCGACHTIPGITGADALVGPPLDRMSQRIYLAGLLRNTPDNMVMWLMDPQRIVPGNAMPNMHLKQEQARDIAAYLYTLR